MFHFYILLLTYIFRDSSLNGI